jgi:hypothetical protein
VLCVRIPRVGRDPPSVQTPMHLHLLRDAFGPTTKMPPVPRRSDDIHDRHSPSVKPRALTIEPSHMALTIELSQMRFQDDCDPVTSIRSTNITNHLLDGLCLGLFAMVLPLYTLGGNDRSQHPW